MSQDKLSVKELGHITLLQSMVTLIPDPDKILDAVTHELQGLTAIDSIDYFPDTRICRDAVPCNSAYCLCLEIRYRQHAFGCFNLHYSNDSLFQEYLPFLRNLMNMLGIILEEKKQRQINEALTTHLEQRVEERTRELMESNEKYMRLIEGLGPRHCVFSHTIEGVFVYASSNFKYIFGIPAEEITGKNWRVIPMTKDSIEAGNLADKKLLEEKTFQRVELTVRHPDGHDRIIEVYYGPVIENNRITHIEGICTDITDRSEADRLIQRTQKLESLGTLAGGIAHDFNNLLGGIFGYMDLVIELTTDETAREYLAKSLSTIDRARSLTNQLLTFAKGGEPIKTIMSLIPLLSDTVRFALSGSNLSCTFDISDDLWLCDIDKNQISQVIDNLIINAKQAMPEGGTIEVTAGNLSVHKGDNRNHPNGKYIRISITDHGTGIPEQQLPFIFDPFYTTKDKGHGLGLATSHSIITRHGGYMEVQSKDGEGTTFTVLLPATGEAAPAAPLPENNNKQKGSGTILIMDDEDVLLETTTAMLESLGYDVICTRNGNEVLSRFSGNGHDIPALAGMIFDLTIPGAMGGKETIKKIREITPELPIFVASGYADNPVMATPEKFGFTASILKPFRKEELAKLLFSHRLM